MADSSKPRVTFGITKSNFGGAQRYVFDLAMEARKRGCEVDVICGGKGILVDKLKHENIYPHLLSSLSRDVSFGGDLRSFIQIWSTLKKIKPDIFHINSSKMGLGAVAGRLSGVEKIIFTAHGLPQDEDRSHLAKNIIKFFSWLTFLFSHQVIALSEDNFKKIKRMPFMKSKVVLIHNSIQAIEFSERNNAKEFLSSVAWKPIPQDKIWIGTISELVKNKGLVYILHSLALLSHKNWVFVIIGTGEDRMKLIKLAEELDISENIFLLGFIDNAPRYLKAFDIFTLTSVKEGHPYVLLEAGEASLPIVASSISGIKDIIENGVSGLLPPPKDIKGIKSALDKLLTDEKLRTNLGKNLYKKVTENYSFNKMINSTIELYRK